MIYQQNETHDPTVKSWVDSANLADTDFPVQNLPFGVFNHRHASPHIGVAIGDQILDLYGCSCEGLLNGVEEVIVDACQDDSLNSLMGLGSRRWSALRRELFALLREGSDRQSLVAQHLVPMTEATMVLPASIGDYTDFYASIYHATNVGSMFRPENPLLSNYKWLPVGYHGRSSSIVPSGSEIVRPQGQIKVEGSDAPVFGPTQRLDYELEMGMLVGVGTERGQSIPISDANEHMFGLCLVNDWSARDVQSWEYQPLGPFLAKNFATTIGCWVVTAEALTPFRCAAFQRDDTDPEPLAHLWSTEDQRYGGLDISLEVYLSSREMRQKGCPPMRLSRGNFLDMYWTLAQMIVHHTSNGCNLRPGDLLASGTVSGAEKSSRGCLLELTWKGRDPIALPTGEERAFLEDGDEVIMRAFCEREGTHRIGFGECRGMVVG